MNHKISHTQINERYEKYTVVHKGTILVKENKTQDSKETFTTVFLKKKRQQIVKKDFTKLMYGASI